jgi:hypothetical protein
MTLQVWPRTDEIRKVLYHPTGKYFPAEGPADWPEDTYTARRIADGDVLTEDPGAPVARKGKAEAKAERHES